MPERLRAGATDAAILVFLGRDRAFALGALDAGEFELLSEHFGKFFERDFDLADVTAGLIACLSLAVAIVLAFADGRTVFSITLADASRTLVAVAEMRDLDIGDGDADVLAPLAADHLAVRDVLPQVLADFPAQSASAAAGRDRCRKCHG